MDQSKRVFFRQFLGELFKIKEEIKGNQFITIKELSLLPDEQVLRWVPAFFEHIEIQLKDGVLRKWNADNNQYDDISDIDKFQETIFYYIDGSMTVSDISQWLSEEFNFPFDDAFKKTKKFILFLLSNQICLLIDDCNEDTV